MEKYTFIEVMACPGGCIGGGGQPRTKIPQAIPAKRARIASLYAMDQRNPIHASWQNMRLQNLYDEFLENPLSEKSVQLLHTHYVNKHYMLGKMILLILMPCRPLLGAFESRDSNAPELSGIIEPCKKT